MFKSTIWHKDHLLLNGLVFRLQHGISGNWKGDNDHFIFYKDKKLLDQYDLFFKSQGDSFCKENIVELGMWDGGSAVFWNEILKPKLLVGIDIIENGGNEYFKKYLKNINASEPKLDAYWGTDQTNATKLREIVKKSFREKELDIIFDDASHMYFPSLISFNTLFPYLKKGGLYIIEDWAWGHWPDADKNYLANSEPTRLIFQLIEAAATVGLIESVTAYSGFTVVKRGDAEIEGSKENFELKNYIYRRPKNLMTRLKNAAKIVLNKD